MVTIVAVREQDCVSLEQGTRVPFTQWKATVDRLLSEDGDSLTSVKHWLAVVAEQC